MPEYLRLLYMVIVNKFRRETNVVFFPYEYHFQTKIQRHLYEQTEIKSMF